MTILDDMTGLIENAKGPVREEQRELLTLGNRLMSQGSGYVLAQADTGIGKTLALAAMALRANPTLERKALVLVDDKRGRENLCEAINLLAPFYGNHHRSVEMISRFDFVSSANLLAWMERAEIDRELKDILNDVVVDVDRDIFPIEELINRGILPSDINMEVVTPSRKEAASLIDQIDEEATVLVATHHMFVRNARMRKMHTSEGDETYKIILVDEVDQLVSVAMGAIGAARIRFDLIKGVFNSPALSKFVNALVKKTLPVGRNAVLDSANPNTDIQGLEDGLKMLRYKMIEAVPENQQTSEQREELGLLDRFLMDYDYNGERSDIHLIFNGKDRLSMKVMKPGRVLGRMWRLNKTPVLAVTGNLGREKAGSDDRMTRKFPDVAQNLGMEYSNPNEVLGRHVICAKKGFGQMKFVYLSGNDPMKPGREVWPDGRWGTSQDYLAHCAEKAQWVWENEAKPNGQNMVVYVQSYRDLNGIMERMSLDPADVIYPISGKKSFRKALNEFKDSEEPKVFFATVAAGWDAPGKVHHMVVTRVPFSPPDEDDDSVWDYLDNNRMGGSGMEKSVSMRYTINEAIRKLAQIMGRGVRGPDDQCTVYFLDSRVPPPAKDPGSGFAPDSRFNVFRKKNGAAKYDYLEFAYPKRFRSARRLGVFTNDGIKWG